MQNQKEASISFNFYKPCAERDKKTDEKLETSLNFFEFLKTIRQENIHRNRKRQVENQKYASISLNYFTPLRKRDKKTDRKLEISLNFFEFLQTMHRKRQKDRWKIRNMPQFL